MYSPTNMNPTGLDNRAGSSPNLSTPTSKRPASSPLAAEERQVRIRQEDENMPETPPELNNDAGASNQPLNEPPQIANDNTQNSAINNIYFPTFKLLRKLNNKLITAQHHKNFLTGLQSNGQVPKGLQLKSAPTGAELDLDLYHQWEEAHIELSNKLRDTLIKHWICTEANLSNLITEHTERLRNIAPPEQTSLILSLITRANTTKATELSARRLRKRANAPGASVEGGPGYTPPTNQQ